MRLIPPARAAALGLALALGPLATATLPGAAVAQEAQVFESRDGMRAELDALILQRQFVRTVETFAPPQRVSVGRVRVLEDRYRDVIGPLEKSAHLFVSEPAPGMVREVVAYWNETTYVYVGLMSHQREDGVAVLDFRLTGDVREATRWFLAGDAPQ